MFSCAPPSIENNVLMLPCPRTSNSRCSSDTSFEVAGEQARGRPSRTVSGDAGADAASAPATRRPIANPTPAARFAVHGASTGTLLGHPIESQLRQRDRGDRERADLRDEARCSDAIRPSSTSRCAPSTHVLYVATPTSPASREDRVVARAQPRAPTVDGRAVRQLLRPDPAADPVARFEHGDRLARLRQSTGSGQTGVSGADHADVDVDPLSHRRTDSRLHRVDVHIRPTPRRRTTSPSPTDVADAHRDQSSAVTHSTSPSGACCTHSSRNRPGASSIISSGIVGGDVQARAPPPDQSAARAPSLVEFDVPTAPRRRRSRTDRRTHASTSTATRCPPCPERRLARRRTPHRPGSTTPRTARSAHLRAR